MPGYTIRYLTERTMTVWMPDEATDAQKSGLALDHIAHQTFSHEKSKLLSIEPVMSDAAVTERIVDSIAHLKPKPQK